jgi:hypothetical protein
MASALWCLFCLTTSLAAETHEKPAPDKAASHARARPVARWTVMVFMNGDNDLEEYLIADFLEMTKVSNSNLVNIVVQLDRLNGAGDYGNWTDTRRFKIKKDLKPFPESALEGYREEADMGDPKTLKEFVRWARAAYPARHYMLIIGDHGDGWRFIHSAELLKSSSRVIAARQADLFAAALQMGLPESRAEELPHLPYDKSSDAPYRSISRDETNKNRLFMREVQDALEEVFTSGEKLDILGFDSCLMEMVENGFALRHVAKVMVGSEELEPGSGWQYDDWLQQLVQNPSMDAETLAGLLVRSYEKTYTLNPTPKLDTTLSAVNLSRGEMDALAQSISALSEELIVSLGHAELRNIQKARDNCTPFDPGSAYHGIDLYRFCEQLAQMTKRRPLRLRAESVMRILRRNTIARYAASGRQGRFGSHGIAIYFPASGELFRYDPFHDAYIEGSAAEYPVDFVQRHRWDNFLQEYYKLVR